MHTIRCPFCGNEEDGGRCCPIPLDDAQWVSIEWYDCWECGTWFPGGIVQTCSGDLDYDAQTSGIAEIAERTIIPDDWLQRIQDQDLIDQAGPYTSREYNEEYFNSWAVRQLETMREANPEIETSNSLMDSARLLEVLNDYMIRISPDGGQKADFVFYKIIDLCEILYKEDSLSSEVLDLIKEVSENASRVVRKPIFEVLIEHVDHEELLRSWFDLDEVTRISQPKIARLMNTAATIEHDHLKKHFLEENIYAAIFGTLDEMGINVRELDLYRSEELELLQFHFLQCAWHEPEMFLREEKVDWTKEGF